MRINNLWQFSAYSVIGTVTLMPLLVLPAMVGILVDEAGMSEPFAGWVASFNFFGGALIALLMALRIHRLDLRRIAAIGLGLSILLDSISAFTAAPDSWFMLLRFFTGMAAGAAHIAALAAFARHAEVERGYGLFVTLQFIVSGLGLYVLPVYAAELGVKGMYLMFASLGLLSLMLIPTLPGRAVALTAGSTQRSELSVLLAMVTLLAILGYGVFEAANTAQFTYIERYGISISLSDRQIGTALMIASMIGIPGAFAIVIFGGRFGRLRPLAFGLGLAIAGLVMLLGSNGFAWYFIGSCCVGFAWAFCLPYIQSLMASLDPKGSAIAAGSSSATIGGAAGPGLAALIVGDGNYEYVFLLSIILFLVAISCFLVSERRAQAAEAIA